MKTMNSIKLILAIFSTALIVTGCASFQRGMEGPTACPMCKGELKTTSIATVKCDKVACAECGASKAISAGMPASMMDYLPPEAAKVGVCAKCNCAVGICPKCRK